MDWTSPLRSQQTSFITRLTQALRGEAANPEATGLIEGMFCAATVETLAETRECVPIEQLSVGSATASQLRATSRELILESDPSLSVRDLLRSYLREQLIQLTLRTVLGDRVGQKTTEDYLNRDQLGLFQLRCAAITPTARARRTSGSSNSSEKSEKTLRLRVLWLEGDQIAENLNWFQPLEETPVDLLLCLWIREPITEVCNRYHVVLGGFLPEAETPGEVSPLPIEDLLYIGGLPYYLETLAQTSAVKEEKRDNWFQSLTTASNYVYPFAIGASGRTIVSSSYDGSLRIWTMNNLELIESLSGSVRSISPNTNAVGTHPLSSDTAETQLKLFQSGSAVLTRHLTGHPSGISAVTLSPSGQLVVSGCDDGSMFVWELNTGDRRDCLRSHRTSIKALAIASDDTLLVSSATDRTLKVWDLQSGNLRYDLTVGEVTISLAIAPNGRILVSGTQSGRIQMWNLADGTLRRELPAHAGMVQGLMLDPTGTFIASTSTERTIKLWNLETGQQEAVLTGHPTPLISLSPQPGSQWVDLSLFQHQQPGWTLP